MTHEHIQELLPAYALDALTAEETRAVEAHVQGCQECQRDLAAFSTVAAVMADSVVMTTPPPPLRARVLEAARQESRLTAPPRVRERPQPTAIWPRGWAVGLAAAAAVLAVVIGAMGLLVTQRLAELNAQLSRAAQQLTTLNARITQQEQLLAIVVDPATSRRALAGTVAADVQFVYDATTRQGALIVRNLTDPGQGLVYQLWLVAGTRPESAGVFRPTTGRPLVLPVTADFNRYQAVAISVEHGPDGAAQPSATPILSATL